MPVDYSKAKIYRIYSPSNPDAGEYIGASVQSLSSRMCKHRDHYQRYLAGTFHKLSSFDILKYDDARIELVEECPCENKEQLSKKEGEYIRGGSNIVNMVIPGRTKQEHYYDFQVKNLLKSSKYYESHKTERREYYLKNREEILKKALEKRETERMKKARDIPVSQKTIDQYFISPAKLENIRHY